MSPVEQRKVLCSITFHVVAITCVVWSLYVLIDRTAEEMRSGVLEWPFWTKLIVVAIGFTGGLVFMYVQCKMYAQLFRRWRAFNRIIYVQDAPEKMAMKLADLGPANVTPLNANLVISDVSDTVARSYEKHPNSPVEEFHSCHSGSAGAVSDNRASSGDVTSGQGGGGGTNRYKQSPTKMTKSLDDLSSGKPPLLGGGVFQSSVLELSDQRRRGADPTNHFYTVVLLPEESNALAGVATGSDVSARSLRDYDSTIVRVLESSSLRDCKD